MQVNLILSTRINANSQFNTATKWNNPFAALSIFNAMNRGAIPTPGTIYAAIVSGGLQNSGVVTGVANSAQGLSLIGSTGLIPFTVKSATHRIINFIASVVGSDEYDVYNANYYGSGIATQALDFKSTFFINPATNQILPLASPLENNSFANNQAGTINVEGYQKTFRRVPYGQQGTVNELLPLSLPGLVNIGFSIQNSGGALIPSGATLDGANLRSTLSVLSQIVVDIDPTVASAALANNQKIYAIASNRNTNIAYLESLLADNSVSRVAASQTTAGSPNILYTSITNPGQAPTFLGNSQSLNFTTGTFTAVSVDRSLGISANPVPFPYELPVF